MRRYRWVVGTVAFAFAWPAVAAAETRVFRSFNAVDIGAAATAAAEPGWDISATPLYGGSDHSAVMVYTMPHLHDAHAPATTGPADVDADDPAVAKVVLLFDVPPPAGLASGDAVIGRMGVSRYNQNTDHWPPDTYGDHPVRAELLSVTPGGGAKVLVRAAIALTRPQTVRLPITFDAAHPPGRFQLRLLLPDVGRLANDGLRTTVEELRIAHGDGTLPPTTQPTHQPSPAWPPVGAVPRLIRTFAGNDFDPHIPTPSDGETAYDPVVSSLDGSPLKLQVWAMEPPAAGSRSIPLLSVDDPGVTASRYAATGTVIYNGLNLVPSDGDGINGFAYLELVSDFETGAPLVTRGLADSGLMRAIVGRSGERPFALSVDAGDRRPTRVRLNLVVAGTGYVALSNLQLVQYDPPRPATQPAAAAVPTPPPWWTRDRITDTAAGSFGLVGLLAFAEPLMRRGRGRPLVLSAVVAVGVLGQVYFGWAMAVLGRGEPPRAWAPLLLCAIAGWCVPASIPIVNRRYRDAELRRMRALDAVAA